MTTIELIASTTSNGAGFLACAVLAALATIQLVIVIVNPKGIVDRFYKFGQKYYRIGSMRQGVWGLAKTARQFRVMTATADALIAILGIYFAFLLR